MGYERNASLAVLSPVAVSVCSRTDAKLPMGSSQVVGTPYAVRLHSGRLTLL
jgi:hypothetical protein